MEKSLKEMMDSAAKLERYRWACDELKSAIEAGIFGSISFHMQDGIISASKVESHRKALLDNSVK